MKPVCFLSLLILITIGVHSQTIIPGGSVSGTWESSQSPFHIQGNIVVDYDSTLVIESGVEVLFDGSYKLTVHGLLNASGTVTDSILFTASDPVIGWQGLEFVSINEDLGISNVKYCSFTYGKKSYGYGGAIYVYQAENVLISNCLIKNNYASYGGGIYIDDGWIEISHCKITQNLGSDYAGGIACINSHPFFWDLEITYNTSGKAGGIYFENCPTYSYPFFSDLNISYNNGGEVGGLELDAAPTVVLDNCKIAYNKGRLVGGIAVLYSSLGYWGYPAEKNQVYLNKGALAYDLYFEEYYDDYTTIDIDTFTVINPDSYMVYPPDKFHFIDGIGHGMIEQSDTDLYISELGSDSNDGLTPESPLRSFEYALRKIVSDTANSNTLWVLPGHYNIPEIELATPVYLKNDVRIKATVPGEAILDGDSICRVLYADCKTNYILSGLTIQNGYIEDALGAIWAIDVCGGGLNNISSSGLIDSCDFVSNYSKYFGGCAYVNGICNLNFRYCTFSHNNAQMGGAVYMDGSCTASFSNCGFLQNAAESGGGGISLDGDYHVNLDNCEFIQNTAGYDGAGMHIFDESSGPLNINNCLFSENYSGGDGGGLIYHGNQIRMKNTRFNSNYSVADGAGCFCDVTAQIPGFVNCLFNKNISEKNGGGVYFEGITVSKLINCTFSDNQADSGSAVYQYHLYKLYSINSIYWNKDVPPTDMIHIQSTGYPLTTGFYTNYSDIQGGESSIVVNNGGAHWELGNITDDPAFIDPTEMDYSLNWNSPCIEAGKEDTTGLYLPINDLNGNPRLVNPRIDLGAYEFQLPVGIEPNNRQMHQIRIFPNTANQEITVSFPEEKENQQFSLEFYSIDGKILKEIYKYPGNLTVQADVSDLPVGIYIIRIKNKREVVEIDKIIISR
jgi:predicted outer membrane repeat protein